MNWKPIAIVVIAVLSIGSLSYGETFPVDASSTAGSPDGSTWPLAFPTLQDALAIPPSGGDIIWVAAGTYTPDQGGGESDDDRGASFVLPAIALKIYGGFAGDEGELADRNIALNPTILSGEIGTGAASDNSYHGIVATDTLSTLRLDGFTIEYGYADGTGDNEDVGGAILIAGDGSTDSELRVYNCIFRNNYADLSGGAIHNFQGSPVFVNCQFIENGITGTNPNFIYTDAGGAIYTDGGATPAYGGLALVNVHFSKNDAAEQGGALYANHCAPTLTHCTFWENTITSTSCAAEDDCGGGGDLPHVRFKRRLRRDDADNHQLLLR